MRLLPIAVLGVAAVVVGCGGAEEAADTVAVENEVVTFPARAQENYLPCTDAHERANFAYYSLGREFAGRPLVAVLRECGRPFPDEPIRPNEVTFIYGIEPGVACETPPDQNEGGCSPPIQVQSHPACELGTYADPTQGNEGRTVRGVPVSAATGGDMHLLTGATSILISGERDLIEQAVDALRMEPRTSPPADLPAPSSSTDGDLPPPVPGAVSGELPCTS